MSKRAAVSAQRAGSSCKVCGNSKPCHRPLFCLSVFRCKFEVNRGRDFFFFFFQMRAILFTSTDDHARTQREEKFCFSPMLNANNKMHVP
ncbi:unnamed protein product [Ixodes pacificus]